MANKSVFAKYNKVRRQDGVDQVRLNRALGVAQKASTPFVLGKFETTAEKCGCGDWIFRMQHEEGGKCKHQLAKILMAG
jgi:hypothetical protein